MDNFFHRLFGQTQTNLNRQNSQEYANAKIPEDKDLDIGEKEDEGYLLVGQIATGSSGQMSSPAYDHGQFSKTKCTIQQSPAVFSAAPKPVSPVSDVPFKFHPAIDTQQQINDMFNGVDLEVRQFNWGKYSHDFTNEKLCLRDLSCGEEANIDEFVISSCETANVRNSHENLIDL